MNQIEQAITTVDVAEMMEVQHKDILAKLEGNSKIKGIIPVLTGRKIPLSDYFVESTYKDGSGKENKCYLVTKLGCDFLANKFTGEKGVLFTARYVKKFHEMEDQIVKPKSQLELLELELKAIKEVDSKIDSVDKDLQKFKQDMPLLALECQRITRAKNQKVVPLMGGKTAPAYKDKSLMNRVYRDLESQIKREFGVDTYKAIKRNQCDHAIEIINSYQLPLVLQEEIGNANLQMAFA